MATFIYKQLLPFKADVTPDIVGTSYNPILFIELCNRLKQTVHIPDEVPKEISVFVTYERARGLLQFFKDAYPQFDNRIAEHVWVQQATGKIKNTKFTKPRFEDLIQISEKEVADEHQTLLQEIHDVLGPSSKLQGILVKMANSIFKRHGTRSEKN